MPSLARLRRTAAHLASGSAAADSSPTPKGAAWGPAASGSTAAVAAGQASAQEEGRSSGAGHAALVALFQEFRRFQQGVLEEDEPDFTPAAVARQYGTLQRFQGQLAELQPAAWPVPEQVDYHLVRAEMNGLDFRHRVMKPWVKDPGCYVDIIPRVRIGEDSLPLSDRDAERAGRRLRAVRGVVEQAKANMADISAVAADLGTLATYRLEEYEESFASLQQTKGLTTHHPALAEAAADALGGVRDYMAWIEENKPSMKAAAGCGKENYGALPVPPDPCPDMHSQAGHALTRPDGSVQTGC